MPMESAWPMLSLIVPVYNESGRLREPLKQMGEFLAAQSYSAEIVVVDDGSRDHTFQLVQEVAVTLPVPVRAIRYESNRGKGYALKVGFDAARGELLLFTDCDLSTPLDEASALLAALEAGYDIAIGSRKIAGATITRHQPWLRERLGMVFTALVRALIADVSDATCGFKAYRRVVGKDLFSRLRVHDWSFDAEILLIAKRRGYRVCEVPVCWEDREGSRVSLLRDIVNSLIGLGRIRIAAAAGHYDRPVALDAPTEVWSTSPESDPGEIGSESEAS